MDSYSESAGSIPALSTFKTVTSPKDGWLSWPKALVLKTKVSRYVCVGSNPTPSFFMKFLPPLCLVAVTRLYNGSTLVCKTKSGSSILPLGRIFNVLILIPL